MILKICKLVLVCFVLLFISKKSYASAWTRDKNEALFILESITSSSKLKYIYENPKNNEEYFVKQETKIYGEFGLIKNFTVGGFFKLYSIKNRNNESGFEKITDDKFAEIFFIKKFWSNLGNKKVFSFRTAYAKPIKYTKGKSERLNYAETREALDLKILLGFSNNRSISNPYYIGNGYFLNIETGLRLLKDSFYNEFIFESILGFKANQSSVMLLKYEFNYDYYQDSFFKKVGRSHSANYGQVVYGLRKESNYYLSDTHHKVKLSSLVHFDDYFSLEAGIYKSFNERIDTEGVILSLWVLF